LGCRGYWDANILVLACRLLIWANDGDTRQSTVETELWP